MEIRYRSSEDDVVRAAKLIARKKSIWYVFCPVLGGVMFLAGLFQAVKPGLFTPNPMSNFAPMFLGAFLLSVPWLTTRSIRKLYRNTPLLQEWRTLEIDDSGLHFNSLSADSTLSWSVFTRLLEDKHSLVLMQQGSLHGVPIPKRELSQFEIDQLRSILEAHLPRR